MMSGTSAGESPSNVQGEQPPMRAPTHQRNVNADTRSPVEPSETGDKPPCHDVMKYMVPILVAILTLPYQNKPESPLVENPALLWFFLVSTFIYWSIREIMTQRPNRDGIYFQIFKHVALASGILSPLSLVSVLLPHRVSFVPLMVGALALVVLAGPLFYSAYTWLHAGISNFTNKLQASRFWANGHNLSKAASSQV